MELNQVRLLIPRVSQWIENYAVAAGIKTLVAGVSGGVDSSVVTRLCELTKLPVCCVAMPMWLHSNSDPTALQRAMELCVGRPTIDFHIREIGPIVQAYQCGGIGRNKAENQLLEGNLRARIRANILYDFAGALNGIVVGTGNEDEDEIGYMTKGGDGLVDICPLSKFHKSVVRQMAIELNVPRSSIEIASTAGLWDGQTDEGELGMTYDEIAWAIDQDDRPVAGNVVLSNRQSEVLSKVRRMRRQNAHKLAYPPVFDPNKD